ncbi:hypothetical protein EC01288_4137, partial [Escherichia coli 0.1288]
MKSLTTETAL